MRPALWLRGAALAAIFALLGSCQWTSITPLTNVAASSPDGTLVFYDTHVGEQSVGPQSGVYTWTTRWTLQFHNDMATLTMTSRDKEPLVLQGSIESTNGGIPHQLHQVSGPQDRSFHVPYYPADIKMSCAKADVPVHARGATFRYRCGGWDAHDGGWSDKAVAMPVIKCTIGRKSDGLGDVLLFAKSSLEEIGITCAAFDMISQLHGGYRLAGLR